MGLMGSLLDAMGLKGDDEWDDDYYEDEEVDTLPEEKPKKAAKKYNSDDTDDKSKSLAKDKPAKASKKITPFTKSGGASNMEVCVIKPTEYPDCREIVDTLLDDHAVVINMEGLDIGVSQRIIDFVSGACFSMEGNLQKISSYIFLATPHAIEISGDLQSFVDAFDFTGIQTGF